MKILRLSAIVIGCILLFLQVLSFIDVIHLVNNVNPCIASLVSMFFASLLHYNKNNINKYKILLVLIISVIMFIASTFLMFIEVSKEFLFIIIFFTNSMMIISALFFSFCKNTELRK